MPGNPQVDRIDDGVVHASRSILWNFPGATFLAIALLWTTGWCFLMMLSALQPRAIIGFFAAMGGLGPTIAGLFCVLLAEGELGIQRIVQQLFQPHQPALWLIIPLAAAPTVSGWLVRVGATTARAQLVTFCAQLMSSTGARAAHSAASAGAVRFAVRALSAGLGIAAGHVMGWHGFLTTHLMRNASPVRTAFLIGWFAAVWQLIPSYVIYAPQHGTTAYLVAVFEALEWIPHMAALTALYLVSRGSLLLCLAWHTIAAAARVVAIESAAVGDNAAVRAALSLAAANLFALPAWAWLWRNGTQRRKAELLRKQQSEASR